MSSDTRDAGGDGSTATSRQVTFRADGAKVERPDELLLQLHADGELSRKISRSDLLRFCLDNLLGELERRHSG